MRPGARTPEELETLLEDAFLTRDPQALCDIFEQGGVLVGGSPAREAHGSEAIWRLARVIFQNGSSYLAEPLRVVQARDTAVVLANGGINVVRRGSDGGWRYAIALLAPEHTIPNKEIGEVTKQSGTGLSPSGGSERWRQVTVTTDKEER